MKTLRYFYAVLLFVPSLAFAINLQSNTNPDERVLLSGSIKPVSGSGTAGGAHITRSVLRSDELAASMPVVVGLEMRNQIEFHTRIDGGAKISAAEMASRFLPLQSDYDKVATWLNAEGFTIDDPIDPKRLNIFAHHSVSNISRVFKLKFARVATAEGEFTSAVTAPSVPMEYAASILGILGLQPHLRFHTHYTLAKPGGSSRLSPTDIRTAYNVPSTLTGAGQAIAVIMQGPGPVASDLTTFWSDAKVAQTSSNYTCVTINGGAFSPSGAEFEGALDVEWSSGMAPNASVRFYNIPYLDDLDAAAALTQVAADRLTVPNLNVVTMSFGASEWGTTADDNLDFHEIFGVLANDGVTLFASSGDGGSNPDNTGATNDYGSGFALDVEYPASDTYVTAVGGTDLQLNSNGSIQNETAWFLDTNTPANATGGGISSIYGRPSWQVGSSLPSGSFRVVPDVAACASNVKGSGQNMFVIYDNNGMQLTGGIGTSFSSPIWAGICACLNQARANAGQGPLGQLGPRIYPLLGSSAFQDITNSGTRGNGAYSAGTGYDYLTGIGSPNVANLAADLVYVALDFTKTGNPDILWQNSSSGECGIYLMNGISVTGWADLGIVPTQWKIAGTGDFLGDGNTDIIWQNSSTGDCGIYMMSGTTVTGWVDLGNVPANWKIAGTADFAGDGNTDIVWQNSATGVCGIYMMNGTSVVGWVSLGTVPAQWQIAAVGVFNSAGQPNILWHNTATGEYGFYLMNGTAVTGWAELGIISSDWQVGSIGDYNLDGNTDILWRNSSTGECGFYLMNGTTVTGWAELGMIPLDWQVAP
jgi:kumamolisin